MYFDKEYPRYLEVSEDYWECSHNVQYIEKEENENSNSR